MNTFKKLLMVGLLASTALYAGQAMAQLAEPTESGIGETTTSGPVGVGVTIPRLITESGEYSIEFGTYTGTGALTETEALKVGLNYGNAGTTGLYDITATDQGSAAGFFLDDVSGVNDSIPLTINAQNKAAGGSTTIFTLVEGTAQSMDGGWNSLDLSTLQAANLAVGYNITAANLQAAMAGRYVGYINFLFAPTPEDPGTGTP